MRVFFAALVGLSVLAFALPAPAQQILIDDFATPQGPVTVNPGPGSQTTSVASGSAIGGGRVMRVSTSAGGNMSAVVTGGQYSFTRSAGIAGTSELWWDGNADTNFDLGLGANLTANGQSRFRLTVVSSTSASLNMRISVYTTGADVSQADFTLPTGGGIVDVPYSSFTVAGGAGATFSSANNIFLSLVNTAGDWNGVIEEFRTVPVELQSFEVD
ncbi:MAG TPA: hypothetical protein VGR00_14045 [Thermoanaerobaculia bacterium]|jgi:hypothetical protein|nr:hypothetical protein [Thermoanaerobaculia bacterium]